MLLKLHDHSELQPALGWIFSSDLVRRRALTSIGRAASFNIVGWSVDVGDEKQWVQK